MSWATTVRFPNSIPENKASIVSAGISSSLARSRLPVADESTLLVGGLTPFTTIDFPGRLAAVVFCQGCPWRCGYCHNPQLLAPHAATPDTRAWLEVTAWLETRRGLLDGVVFSGGEPLLQRGLAAALSETRALGFATALHTAGVYPHRLAAVLPSLDWVGFDVKAPFGDYARITGAGDGAVAREALSLLLASGVAHEVRCTVLEGQLNGDDMAQLAGQLAELGVSRLILQACRTDDHRATPPAEALRQAAADFLACVELRY